MIILTDSACLVLLNLLLLYLFNQIQSQHFHFAYDVFSTFNDPAHPIFCEFIVKNAIFKKIFEYMYRVAFSFLF